jgi:ABC-type Mn2+/Zn2+ transport system ATPase subunit
MGQSLIVVGTNGTGKTTWVKERIKKVNPDALLIYDVNNEYTEFYPHPFEKFPIFMQKTVKVNNAVLVFEEATIFFKNKSSNDELRELLVRRRHTYNTLILVFHSIRAIPRDVMDMSNYMIVKKTIDSPDYVDRKLEHHLVTQACINAQESKDEFYTEIVKLN